MPCPRVLPILDLTTGLVQLRLGGTWHTYHTVQPQLLARLLACSAGPVRFDPAACRLLLVVAANRHPAGREHAFSLAKFPAVHRVTKLEGDGSAPPSVAEAPYRV